MAISQMDEYGFDTIGKGLGFTGEQITYARMLIVGRMVHPASERETVRCLSETIGQKQMRRRLLYQTEKQR